MKKMFGKKLAFLLAAAVLAAGAFTSCEIGSESSDDDDKTQSVDFKKFDTPELDTTYYYYVNKDGDISTEEKDGYVFEVLVYTNVGGYYFCYLEKYTGSDSSVSIPEGVREISYQAFNKCENLESVVLPIGVDTLSKYAFYECEALKTVTIPDSVTDFHYNAFYSCTNLTSVNYAGTKEQLKSMTGSDSQSFSPIRLDGYFLGEDGVVTCKDGKLKWGKRPVEDKYIEYVYDWIDVD